jgi:serine/threonine-protein kinase
VLYVHGGDLFAAPFDLTQLTVSGAGVPVIENIRSNAVSGVADVAVSRDGLLAYLSRDGFANTESPIDIVDRKGTSRRLGGLPVNWVSVAFSPNGQRLALEIASRQQSSIWTYDLSRDALERVIFGEAQDMRPVWTVKGDRITFARGAGGAPNLYWQDADGGKPERLTTNDNAQFPGSWSPDGRELAYTELRNGAGDVMLLPMEGDDKTGLKPGTPRALFATDANESHPAFSPDGQWLAFASNESTVHQVYVASIANPTRRWQVSIDGGSQPMWSRNGLELLFISTENSVSSVLFVTYQVINGAFRPSRPALWTDTRFNRRPSGLSDFGDVTLSDDGRLAGSIGIPGLEQAPSEPLIRLVTNFFEELRTKVTRKD